MTWGNRIPSLCPSLTPNPLQILRKHFLDKIGQVCIQTKQSICFLFNNAERTLKKNICSLDFKGVSTRNKMINFAIPVALQKLISYLCFLGYDHTLTNTPFTLYRLQAQPWTHNKNVSHQPAICTVQAKPKHFCSLCLQKYFILER